VTGQARRRPPTDRADTLIGTVLCVALFAALTVAVIVTNRPAPVLGVVIVGGYAALALWGLTITHRRESR
jgi:nitrate reductase NapE component